MSNSHKHRIDPFTTDSPKLNPSEDELERAPFCREIANTLASWKNEETWVVSLTGEWGTGKTTIRNFIRHYLEKSTPKPVIIDFNPWEWSRQDKVFEGFFWEIGAVFGKTDQTKNLRRFLRKWRGLGTTLQMGKMVADDIPTWIPTGLNLAMVAGVAGAFSLPNDWAKASAGVLAGLATLSLCLGLPEKICSLLNAQAREVPLDDLREEIAEELRGLECPIIIFIDDIDRLTEAEIATLFQLVKSNIQLPNLIFFLLFQKSVVTNALGKLTSEDGDKFLRKLVQIEWETPTPPQALVMGRLVDGINQILKDGSPNIAWDQHRWNAIFDEGLWRYFSNLRDIKRFLTSLQFYFRLQLNGNVLELNPIDFVAIEVLRVFDNRAYLDLARKVKWSAKNDALLSYRAKADEEFKKKMESIIDREERTTDHKAALRVILEVLFPIGFGKPGNTDEFLSKVRICHAAHFDKYFRGTMDATTAFASRWAEFLTVAHDKDAITALFEKTRHQGKLDELLRQIWVGRSEVPSSALASVVTALFDVGDNLPPMRPGAWDTDPSFNVRRFVLHRLGTEDQAKSTQILKEALTSTKGFKMPIETITSLDTSVRDKNPARHYLTDNSEVPWLEAHGLKLILKRAEEGTLLKEEGDCAYLCHWTEWGKKEDAVKWASEFVSSPHNALLFLRSFVNPISYGDGRREPQLSGEFVDGFCSIEKIHDLVTQAPESDLTVDDRAAIRLLALAVSQKKAALPYTQLRMQDLEATS